MLLVPESMSGDRKDLYFGSCSEHCRPTMNIMGAKQSWTSPWIEVSSASFLGLRGSQVSQVQSPKQLQPMSFSFQSLLGRHSPQMSGQRRALSSLCFVAQLHPFCRQAALGSRWLRDIFRVCFPQSQTFTAEPSKIKSNIFPKSSLPRFFGAYFPTYPLLNCPITMVKITMFNGKNPNFYGNFQ